MPASDLPDGRLGDPGGFRAAVRPEHLVYFLLNVGDGDAQVILLPEVSGQRQAVIVDVANARKVHGLLVHLADERLLVAGAKRPIRLVVATHPHDDHIRGMAKVLRTHAAVIAEVWEPGYYHTSGSYLEMMAAIEDEALHHLQPASGTVLWAGRVKLTVVAPGVSLKGRYDSYGVDVNNSSIVLKLDYPAARVVERNADRTYIAESSSSVILGADAQTLSWGQALVDFPQLDKRKTAVSDALRAQGGTEPLSAGIFKVPHHGSKRGLNFELTESIAASLSLFSSVRGEGKYHFPHLITQEIIREVRQPLATKPATARRNDEDLGIQYTGSLTDIGAPAGTIGVLLSPTGARQVWRFMDGGGAGVQLAAGRQFG